MTRDDEQFRETVAGIVGDGRVAIASIVDQLTKGGVDGNDAARARDRLRQMLQFDTTFAIRNDSVVHVPTLVEGTSWTVFVDRDDADEGFFRSHPHLAALSWWLVGSDVDLVDESGRSLGTLETDGWMLDGRDTDVVLGPDGWLKGLGGGWATVDVVGGALRWSPCDSPPGATPAQRAAARDGFERASGDDDRSPDAPEGLRYTSEAVPIMEALVVDRAAFVDDPIPPLPDLYDAAGLELRGSTVALAGFDWGVLDAWRTRNGYTFRYGLDRREADMLALLVGARDAVLGNETDGDTDGERLDNAIELVQMLEISQVAASFWAEADRIEIAPAEVLRFTDELARGLEPALPPGLAWVRARCLDSLGEPLAAMEVLTQAVKPGCKHAAAVCELAGLLADRGDALLAASMLHLAGLTDDGPSDEWDELDDVDLLVREVTGFSIRPRPMAGRNDRCPCGSGKKYKACHLGREEHSLDDRSEWVYLKAKRFLRGFDPAAVDEVAEASATASERPDFHDGMIDSKLLVDIALHEYGFFAEFLRARDALLPDDEALLAAQWAAVDRGLFEIERAQRDRIDMRNIGTDERITVVNLNPSARLAMSTVLFGRPLPVGDTYRAFSGFIEFPRAAVPAMLSALESTDPYEIAACVGELLRRPRLSNTDGDDMMFHTIRWRVGGASVDDAMQRAGLKRDLGDGPRWTLLRDSRNQPGTVIASFRIVDDGDLVGEVNSDERAEEMVALVADVLPEAELIDDEVRTIDEMRVSRDPDATSTMLDPEDEMVHLALTEYIADYEQRWLDMSIPALDGRTPRDALTDPVGREQVEHLLESMAGSDPADPTTMSADRLRAALGL